MLLVARSEDKERVRLNVINDILRHVPYKELKTPKVVLPKRKIGNYQPSDYSFRYVQERF